MTNLDCAVTNCLYNSDKCCCKGDIKVQGQAAEKVSETCCGSFVERKENVGKNTVAQPSRQIDVACEACKCEFNEDSKCTAQHIGIAGHDACKCSETECASFCCCG